MKLHWVSLGCVKNQVDSEWMKARCRDAGWRLVDTPREADTIVVNTCGFIEAAVSESIDTILDLARWKTEGTCRALVVIGCLVERYRQTLQELLPEVDLFVGTAGFDRIVPLIEMAEDLHGCYLPTIERIDAGSPAPERRLPPSRSAYIKIAEGCNRHCTYCIIPRLRGRQKSRALEAIVSEARQLIDAGAQEVILVAQETTAYGCDLEEDPRLADLLAALAALSEGVWIRFLYGHPETIDERLIDTVREIPHVLPYFDIPIQHGSDRILRRMGRGYGNKDIVRLIDSIRERIPEAVVRTTVITGFPGERRADFQSLLDLVRQLRFEHLGVFVYSDAEDLPSHRLSDPVSKRTAQTRKDRLMALQMDISRQWLTSFMHRQLPVLVEQRIEDGLYGARAWFQAPEVDGMVLVAAQELPIGSRIPVRITGSLDYDLLGETVS